jgi:tetratricopeptide (TPR) repeat protein
MTNKSSSAPLLLSGLALVLLGGFVWQRNRPAVPAASANAGSATSKDPTGALAGSLPSASFATSSDRRRTLALSATKEQAPVDAMITQAQQALKTNPKKIDFWITLGRNWIRKARETSDPGYYLNAEAAASLALDLDPENAAAIDLRAQVLLNSHKFEEARKLAQTLVQKHPEVPLGYGSLSDAELELGLYEEARRNTQKMMDLKPNLPSYGRVAHLAWLHGDIKGARASYRLALDAGRDSHNREPYAWMLVQTAYTFFHTGDIEGSEAGFDKALDWLSDYPPALVGNARVAKVKGDLNRARELLDRAFKASPLVETAWLRGEACAALNDRVCAEEAFAYVRKEGQRSDPRTLALFLGARSLVDSPQPSGTEDANLALKLTEEEMKSRPGVLTEEAHALALSLNNRHDDALKTIAHARRLGTREAHFAFHEGLIRAKKGDLAGMKTAMKQALEINPRFEQAVEAKKRAQL